MCTHAYIIFIVIINAHQLHWLMDFTVAFLEMYILYFAHDNFLEYVF